jgi:hypothetical protein
MDKLVVNCDTGKSEVVPLTREEREERARTDAGEKERLRLEQEARDARRALITRLRNGTATPQDRDLALAEALEERSDTG